MILKSSKKDKWKGRKWGQHLAGPRGSVVRLAKQAGLDWNGANRKGWNGASLTSRSRGAEIFFYGWLRGWAGCRMEWQRMSGMQG